MSSLLPIASYNLELKPFDPQPCQSADFPVTVRLTLAAIDPEAVDDEKTPATLRILRSDDDDDDDDDDNEKDDDSKDDDDDDDDDSSDDAEVAKDIDKEVEEHVICTLSPKTQYQQSLDLVIMPQEKVYFVATGSYTIHLSGYYVDHPYDDDGDDYLSVEDSDDDDDEDYVEDVDNRQEEDDDDENDDNEKGDVIEEGDEDFDLDDLENVDDVEGTIEKLVKKDNEKKNQKKRKSDDKENPKKKAKKSKEKSDDKSVKFSKELIRGPTEKKSEKAEKKTSKKSNKYDTKKLDGGVVIEDRVRGTGPTAKKGRKISVRYVGKLKNGKVFDKNVSGKPFSFVVGRGEVIRGWDVGFAGMSVGGERRIVIPPRMAYGSTKLPGIPANSQLIFDVKLLAIK